MTGIHRRPLQALMITVVTTLCVAACSGGSSSSSGGDLPPGIDFRPLNDTGILFCADADTGINEPCLGDEPLGQDADFGRDAEADLEKTGDGDAGFDYSRLCNNGDLEGEGDCPLQPLRGDMPQQWGCTRDNVTGLTWELKDAGNLSPRFVDHQYSLHDTGNTSLCDASLGDQPCTLDAYVQAVNAEGLCGHQDWRLPHLQELQSLVHYGKQSPPWQDAAFFPEAANAPLWSATSDARGSSVWVVDMNAALPGAVAMDSAQSVRLVRGASLVTLDAESRAHCSDDLQSSTPPQRFSLSGTDTLVDQMTGLMWQRCVAGLTGEDCTQGEALSQDWVTALGEAQEDTLGGFTDWRLPNIRELASLHDTCTHNPALSPLLFPGMPGEALWSASPSAPAGAWQLDAEDGQHQIAPRSSMAYALRVRGGSPRLGPPRSDTLTLRAGAPGESAVYQVGQSESYVFTARAIGPKAALGSAEIMSCDEALSEGNVMVEILHQGNAIAVQCDALPQTLPLPQGLPYNNEGALEYTWEARWTPNPALEIPLGITDLGAMTLRFTSADDIALVSLPVDHRFRLHDINQPPYPIPPANNLLTCETTSLTRLDCTYDATPTAGQVLFPIGIDVDDVDVGTGTMFTTARLFCLAEGGCGEDHPIRLVAPSMSGLQTVEEGRHYRLQRTLSPTSAFLSALAVYSEPPVPGEYLVTLHITDFGNSGSCSYEQLSPCPKEAEAELLFIVR